MSTDDPREQLLLSLWEDIRGWRPETIGNVPAASRAVQAGAEPADVVAAMRCAAYEAVFGVLYRLAEHAPEDAPSGGPGWALVPAVVDEHGEVTLGGDHDLEALYESLLSADPTGREGADFFA